MDQLDILKSKWQAQSTDYPTYSREQLTPLLASKSSSIVKWLFYIAIGEFIFFVLLNILLSDSESTEMSISIMGEFLFYGSYVLHYVAIGIFIYLFWKNYKNISASQPTRSLMKNILKTRKTMKWYIWYNLIYIMLFGVIATLLIVTNDLEFAKLMNQPNFAEHKQTLVIGYIVSMFVILTVICAVLYGFYSLIYGILLRRLKRNYQELKKMEV
ncbi:hypothetical protein [Nonlabens ponticola]|uniref:Beta-carotene 15,15'-monooxygenase n=1 Tax=Nonlabens ponticola TaxID=2496866 RepID=A0A3S9MZZ7_9FLAO|nr:hypothetical protein [Nonlabens ponticola]AZQ44718.1 hypothetical protein EJ995_10885 [Nonlabens ponticola]